MNAAAHTTHLHDTTALCPTCLRELPAAVDADEAGAVWMKRTCPEHGVARTRIWPDAQHYQWLRSLSFPKVAPRCTIPAGKACPSGCGTCARHERKGTLYEIEVTQRCNLRCPVCFMSAEDGKADPTLEEIEAMYDAILAAGGPDAAIQITGGEPTCRKDLPDIVRMGREKGFWGIEINTNGLVIAARDGYLEQLKEAGITGVYLSFDDLDGATYEATCGRDILAEKLKAVQRCREAGVQCVLAATIVSGINDTHLGDLLRFALENADVVAGLALQPAFTSGRFDAQRHEPLTMGDVVFMLAQQSDGLIEPRDLWPLGSSNPLCSTGAFLIPSKDAAHPSGFTPATRGLTREAYLDAYNPSSPQGSIFLDILAKQGVSVSDGLSLIIMNYMDAASMDTQRLRECSMAVAVPNGNILPFCSYHLTDAAGKRIYPPWCKPELAR